MLLVFDTYVAIKKSVKIKVDERDQHSDNINFF